MDDELMNRCKIVFKWIDAYIFRRISGSKNEDKEKFFKSKNNLDYEKKSKVAILLEESKIL